jgi:DsbC/DsbD-like thiol-disulfide interchange protein
MKAILIATTLLILVPFVVQAQVKASLVAADSSVQPGHSTTVALRMEHQPHWHSYWVNAGTGYATSLQWELPAGWTAGDIQWPTPILIRDSHGNVTGHGYDGVLYLPVTVTPPADAKAGEKVTLKAQATWLMCADVCNPGSADVSLTLPVSSGAPKRDAAVESELTKMPMPQAQDGWRMSATRTPKSVTLSVAGGGPMQSAHFFSEDAYIQYDQPQPANTAGGRLTMTLPIASDAEAGTEKLVGILAYTDEKGVYRGTKVSVPFGSGGAAAGIPTAESAPKPSAAMPGSQLGSSQATGVGGASLFATLLLAFLGGLILNLMPCVFPVLGIKIVGFVNEAGSDQRQVTMHGLMFTLGVLLSFWALAGVLAALRAGGQELGWGFQLQSAPFVFGLTVVMLASVDA